LFVFLSCVLPFFFFFFFQWNLLATSCPLDINQNTGVFGQRDLDICAFDGTGTTAQTTSTPSSNKTDLLARRRVSANGRCVTNVLMVTTTVGVLDGVHADTLDVWPAVALGLVLPVAATSLEHWLVDTTSAGNNTNRTTARRLYDLLGAGRQTKTSGTSVRVVRNDRSVVSGRPSELASITWPCLDIADHSTFGEGGEWQNVSDFELRLLSAVHKLAGIQTLNCNEVLC